jgi:hypothetical protein
MWVVRAVLVAVLLLLLIGFAYNNMGDNHAVNVNLRPVGPNLQDVQLNVVVFWSVASGVLLSLLLFVTIYVRQTVDIHAYKKRVKALESEVAILRNRPIEESADLLKGADARLAEIKSPFSEG